MAKITTLIPAYKKEYLHDVFTGLCRQSFKDFKVILSDDSPGQVISQMIVNRHWGSLTDQIDLTVIKGPGSERRNHEFLLDVWAGRSDFVHFHLDDDLILPEFYQSHMRAHQVKQGGVSVSQRWLSRDDGVPVLTSWIPKMIQDSEYHFIEVDRKALYDTAILNCQNWFGELNNMVLTADAAKSFPYSPVSDINYYGLLDLGAVLEASISSPITFIREYLSVFRHNSQQTTLQKNLPSSNCLAYLSWISYALVGWRDSVFDAESTIKSIKQMSYQMSRELKGVTVADSYFRILSEHSSSLSDFYNAYTKFWLELLSSRPDTAPLKNTQFK